MQKKVSCAINWRMAETVQEVKLAKITLAENEK